MRYSGIHSRRKLVAYRQFLEAVGVSYKSFPFPVYANFRGLSTRFFVRVLDSLCMKAEKRIWLEKTPDHLYAIRRITRAAASCKFIHLIRDGKDVAASIREVTQKYPDSWRGQISAVDCVNKWNNALTETRKWIGDKNHLVVRYESFTKNPKENLKAICQFLGIDYGQEMLKPEVDKNTHLVVSGEKWKADSMSNTIIQDRASKFDTVFTEAEQRLVTSNLYNIAEILDDRLLQAESIKTKTDRWPL